ncbi:PP2C family protein-serine/threonine phosphatase [Nocardioides sp. CFH 31398]|uniref:PP2C family protein-serine/threonine phosphatase n=1 Tax=Nocardioides sp. CFH 31398 TaxID=2919579 RepID=UPI001F06A8B2|nr:GAF domain-containing SpoIIE family protein phosphatase [Nocardioides sp. CFH 31398]MCH1867382.1 SpoIIE family protein phosphatase [Nocardioides sp. CFH 31398]MCH1868621.1 SpoIIE family protein phosphatase [Nocardioides sp. CFH 31398]
MTPEAGAEPERRSRGLDALDLLDTPAEERFDRFTRLALVLFDVPIASITLVDGERTFFKSLTRIPQVPQPPASDDFSLACVKSGELLVVPDAREDPTYAGAPTVVGAPRVRFWAGHPVHDAHGTAIGTLALADRRLRPWEDRDAQLLRELARWVDTELQTEGEAQRATAVQEALLPPPLVLDGYDAAAVCLPTSVVSGDFYDHAGFGDAGHLLALADVMGKGTGAAILTATVRASLRAEATAYAQGRGGRHEDGADLGTVVSAVNALLVSDLAASDAFVTGFVAWAHPGRGEVRWVDAGHGLALVCRADGAVEQLRGGDLPLGITADWTWTESSVGLEPGDWFVLTSDGLLDLLGGTMDSLGEIARLALAAEHPRALVERVAELAETDPARDDVTVLAIRRTSPL